MSRREAAERLLPVHRERQRLHHAGWPYGGSSLQGYLGGQCRYVSSRLSRDASNLCPAGRPPNDYFLFIGSDNDFITQDGHMAGQAYKDTSGANVDTLVLVYRVTLPTYVPPGGRRTTTSCSSGATTTSSRRMAIWRVKPTRIPR